MQNSQYYYRDMLKAREQLIEKLGVEQMPLNHRFEVESAIERTLIAIFDGDIDGVGMVGND